ncbi:MAG: diacylglycerol kinase family protein [Acidobacteriota bacterium]
MIGPPRDSTSVRPSSTGAIAVVNPKAGHGRCGRLAGDVLAGLRSAGLLFEVSETRYAGHAVEIARAAYCQGCQRFIAVGGDGTAFEIVNGLYPEASEGPPPVLGFLPLGTGNSFLRDFTANGLADATRAMLENRSRPCDVLRLSHGDGLLHYINLLSVGFVADVCVIANRRYKRLGEAGYLLGVLQRLIRYRGRAFPLRVDGSSEIDRRDCLLLTFNNSKFTGGKMMLAPLADPSDGLIELVRWSPIGRLGLIRRLPALYDGTHIRDPLAWRCAARRIDFDLDEPIDVMVDGEVLTVKPQSIDVLPSALQVMI